MKIHMSNLQMESIRTRLKELRCNGHIPDAEPPAPVAFTDAEAFVERLSMPLRVAPYIALAGDGELNFAWNGNGIYVDLGFYGTGTYSFFAIDQDGRQHHGDDVPAGGPIPESLKQILSG